MITTRTRFLSILATVAMLVSMLACFVIPASADESITAPYAALLEDVSGATNLAAVISTATDETTLSDALAQDVAAGTITWPTWEYGNVDYPRYAYKAVYVAAGYTAKEYSITAPEDWTAMVTASNAATPETFAGYTFHVTNDVDFDATPNDDESNEGIVMYPLNAGTAGKYNTYENPFQGTIDGHGNAFKNINVKDNLTTMTGNRIVGMISRLGDGAVVRNFGVDSGKITMDTASVGRASAATFGQGLPSDTEATKPQLINVWSGVDITVSGTSTASWASGILGYSADTKGGPIVNGAYFFGTLTASGSGTNATHGILYNLRTGHVYNSLSNPGTATYAITLQSNATSSMFKNIYSVGADPVNVGSSAVTATNVTDNNCGNASSVEIGAWEINKANAVAAAADGVDKVFFTITEDGIRPTGDETNRIIKITVNNVDHYINKNTELSQEYVLGLANLEQFTTVTVDGDAASFPLTAADEMEITVAADAGAAVEAAWEAYRELSTTYLSAEAAAAWLEASEAVGNVANAEEGTDTTELINTANGKITALETALADYGTYSTYPAEDGKAVPGYKDVELYGAYNTAHVWTINEPQDWIDMVRDSATSNFDNHVFHVTTDINFEDQPMLPLNFGDNGEVDDAAYRFNGTINGYGNAFKNINVLVEDLDTSATNSHIAVGMIGKLGNKARINNFGVDSGSITVTGTIYEGRTLYVSTFGEALHYEAGTNMVSSYVNDHAELNNVWSGATITAGATTGSNRAAGLLAHSLYSSVSINGGYFFGALSPAEGSFGITTHARQTTVNNVLSDSATAEAMFTSHSAVTAANNVYATGSTTIDATTFAITNYGNVTSALEGAWTINSKQDAEDENAVYFTITGKDEDGNNIIRPNGTADNKIVKVSVNNDEKAIYVNNGTTLNKAYFADLYEVGESAIIINEDASVAEVTANGDTTVAITIDYDALLESIRAEYRKLDAMYLTDTAADALNTFLTSADDAQTVLATEGELKTALTGGVYTTYPATDAGKAVPGYKDVELYGAYNTANVWTINEPQDWIDMVRDSATSNFDNYVFHVTTDINFEDQPMLPLNFGDNGEVDDAAYRFNGTINGYGNAFKNINVRVTLDTSSTNSHIAVGMIGKLGNKARINNFGVDSGSITVDGTIYSSRTLYVSTFGEALHYEAGTNMVSSYVNDHAELNNVWSGATITAGATTGSNMAAGLLAHSLYSSVSINGGYFFGTLSPAEGSFGITTHARQTTVNNVLSDSATAAAMFTSHAAVTAANNVYATGTTTIDATTFAITNYGNVTSALEGAWTINSKQSAEDANAVYFTLKENGDIRFGEEANRIVKVTVNDEPEYVNVGTTLDKAYFVDLLGVSEAAITSITVGEEDYTATGVAAADGLAVTVVLDVNGTYQKQLTDKLAEYDLENLNLDYFKTADELEAGKIGLKAFVEMAQTAIETQTGLDAAVAQIDNVVAEIKGADDYENLPAFKDHALYEEYQPANENWLIVDQADWTEMDRVALGSTESDYFGEVNDLGGYEYFDGVTFHLKDDVIFDYTEDILPLGAYGAAATTARRFSGIIDGHGYGFENIFIKATSDTLQGLTTGYDNRGSLGLFAYLGGCEIRNFGINSGWIEAGTGNYRQPASTFGCVPMSGTTAEDPLVLNNVWNHGWVISSANTGVSGLFGTQGRNNTYDIFAEVDGAVLDGVLAQYNVRQSALIAGVFGGFATAPSENSSLTFSNVIVSADMGFYSEVTKGETPDKNEITFDTTCANGTEVEAKHITLFVLNSADSYNAENFKNVIGITGTNKVQSGAVTRNTTYNANPLDSAVINSAASLLSADYADASAAGYAINTSGTNGDVYFKLVDGNVRPTGTETDKLVKVEATVGEEPKTAYINVNQPYTNAELRDALGYGVETTITNVEVTSGGEYAEGVLTVNGDAEIIVTIDVCEHTDVEYAHDGKNSHTATCAGCGYVFETEACEKNWVAGVVNADGTSVHKATCPDCKHEYEEACPGGTKEQNVDCTEDDTWVFTCGVHADRVVAEGTAETGHDFENGEGWKQDEVDENKQYRQCGHEGCEVKEYRLLGVASASGVELYCKENGTITITLPENLASADLTFAIEGEGYTITHVNGTEWNGGVYAVTAGGEVTVTIAADVTAVGGTFNVEVANAKDAEGTAIEFAGATATIGFTSIEGDANGDKTVNLADALAALYKVAQKPGAADINEKNADIDGTEGFTINDVYAIVREWLRTTLEA